MPREPKYRELSPEELAELEKEFIDFLVINGITADDWERLKKEAHEKAEDMLILFSDVVFEDIMRRVKFLEIRDKSDVKTFQCLSEKLVLVGMHSENPGVDFTDDDFIQAATRNPPAGIKVYTTDKPYSKTRETEIFDMVQAGCRISDGTLFKTLSMALA